MCDVAHGRLQSCCGSHINQLVDDVFSLLDVDKSGFATEKAMCDFLCEQLAADESYAGAVSPAGGCLPAPALASPSPWRLAWSDCAFPRLRTYTWYLSGDQARFAATDPCPVQQGGPALMGVNSVPFVGRADRSANKVGTYAASAASSKNGWIPSEAMDVKSVTMLFREVRLPACYHSCIHDRAHSQKYRHVSYVLIRPT